MHDGVVIWSMAPTKSRTDGVDTTFFQKVHMNVLVWHLLALMTIRSFIYCGDILRQSALELTSSIALTHNTQGSRKG
jgi:hypothetical protein